MDWRRDSFEPAYIKGCLMNVSEVADFDAQFPAHPLSMCRELAQSISG